MIDIRTCNSDEINKLKEFINTHWKKDHILTLHDGLLKWQHSNSSTGKLNFIIGYDILKCEIVGVLGFIPLYQFDAGLIENGDIWLAIWKVKSETKGLGIELLNFLINNFNPKSIGSIGINHRVKKLYQALNFRIGKLIHYYYLNPNTDIFRIAKVFINTSNKTPSKSEYRIYELENFDELIGIRHESSPHKSLEYLLNRYTLHPIYKYQFFGLRLKDSIVALLITRKILINNSACIRIVDIYGDLRNIGSLESEFDKLLNDEKSEYIDCLNFGIPQEVFLNIGFSLPDTNIIPSYFEPFEPVKKDIEFAYLADSDNYVIFKGDSDQDRPNLINYQYEK